MAVCLWYTQQAHAACGPASTVVLLKHGSSLLHRKPFSGVDGKLTCLLMSMFRGCGDIARIMPTSRGTEGRCPPVASAVFPGLHHRRPGDTLQVWTASAALHGGAVSLADNNPGT